MTEQLRSAQESADLVAPHLELTSPSSSEDFLITNQNASNFRIEGICNQAGGAIQIIEPTPLAESGVCSVAGNWSFNLDMTPLDDGVYQFRIRLHSAQAAEYVEVTSASYYKITRPPDALSGFVETRAINTGTHGITHAMSWDPGLDSCGTPLVLYEYSLSSGPLGSGVILQDWSSAGTSTSTTFDVPSGSNVEGGVFHVNIRGTDRAGQLTPVGSSSYQIDTLAPTLTSGPTPSAAVLASVTQGPAITWGFSDGSGSGVAGLEYRILSAGTSSTVRDWTSIEPSSATTVTPSGLSLTQGSDYRFQIRATDRAGNISGIGSADWSVVAPTLAFTSIPSSATVGSSFSVGVTIRDQFGTTLR